MAWKLKDVIYDLFGVRDTVEDLFKDPTTNKGLHQRFIELLAGDLDDNELELIASIVANTQNPRTVFEKFLPYRELTFGVPAFINDEQIRRKVLCFISEINRRKGTFSGYRILLNLLELTDIVITELPIISGFDSPETFDSPVRTFDQKCAACSCYMVSVMGSGLLSAEKLAAIKLMIKYNEPINAKLKLIEYNGGPADLVESLFDPEIGDFIIDATRAPETEWAISDNGELLFLGIENNYVINENGDLIYQFVS